MAVFANGQELPICADYQAKSADHARLIYQEDQRQADRFDFTNKYDK